MDTHTDKTALTSAIADELRAHMARRHVTQEQLAAAIGTTGPTVNRYAQGKRDIPLRTLVLMCGVLGVSAGQLIDDALVIVDAQRGE